jgi:hypothetical protein
VPAPPGVVILALPEVPRNAEGAQSEGPRQGNEPLYFRARRGISGV